MVECDKRNVAPLDELTFNVRINNFKTRFSFGLDISALFGVY